MTEEHMVMCYWCHREFRPIISKIRLVCNECYEKPKELILEFLRDWGWGRVYELHFSWLNYYDHCRCKPTTIGYWKWFEDKWEKRVTNRER